MHVRDLLYRCFQRFLEQRDMIFDFTHEDLRNECYEYILHSRSSGCICIFY